MMPEKVSQLEKNHGAGFFRMAGEALRQFHLPDLGMPSSHPSDLHII
jgi:hypothetical protein